MYCLDCGAPTRAEARYCVGCGAAIPRLKEAIVAIEQHPARFCGACGLVLSPGAVYCAHCGACAHCGRGASLAPVPPAAVAVSASPRPVSGGVVGLACRRVGAALLDGLILIYVFWIGCYAGMVLGLPLGFFAAGPNGVVGGTVGGALAGGLVACFLYIWLSNAAGQGVGRSAAGIRIVRLADGRPPGLGRGLMRAGGYVVSVTPFGLGLLWALVDSRGQTWHDKIAGTLVVRDRYPVPAGAAHVSPR